MAVRDRYRWIALGFTIMFHFIMVHPFAGWLGETLIPVMEDDGVEIELISPDLKEKQVEKWSEEEPPDDQKVDYVFKNLPNERRALSEEIAEDQIFDPHDDAPPPPKNQAVDSKKTDWDLIDQILNEPLDKPARGKKDSPTRDEKGKVAQIAPPESSVLDQQQRKSEALTGEVVEKKSPLFLKPGDGASDAPTPREVRASYKNDRPEQTNWDKLEFSMNTYKWSYKRYIENWAIDIRKWWIAPAEYLAGNIPEGGSIWVRIRLSKEGQLLGYKVFHSKLTSEMELNVIQALIGSLERPSLPENFPEDVLVINWKFIYPPLLPRVNIRREK